MVAILLYGLNNLNPVNVTSLLVCHRGQILGPLLFIMSTKDLELIANKYNFSFHSYADDCQLYFCFKPTVDSHLDDMLSRCLKEVKDWMICHFLKLFINTDKTEFF